MDCVVKKSELAPNISMKNIVEKRKKCKWTKRIERVIIKFKIKKSQKYIVVESEKREC